ncbi:hypothetical protein DFH07DRAFT_967046 [Mycena maculata]|uniref:DRBM domain-containing protein n=1 Tax=Mycena maculata TaxID=230809 RepID=A0AAD7I6G0_9AGAR|nr:hypothetical protein DFH07DRAFT_967046 [Mycena maculata]
MPESITQLNNYLQAKQATHTISWLDYSTGPSHDIKWTVQCKISGELKGAVPFAGTGVANTKAAAKEEAARQALVSLGL